MDSISVYHACPDTFGTVQEGEGGEASGGADVDGGASAHGSGRASGGREARDDGGGARGFTGTKVEKVAELVETLGQARVSGDGRYVG